MPRLTRNHALAALAVLAIAYTAYWFALARIVARDIDNWATLQRAQGYAVSYSQTPLGGFPFSVTVRFLNPDIVAPSGRWRWQGAETRLRILPWAPFDLQLSAPGRHRLSLGGPSARQFWITGDRLTLSLHLSDGIAADRFGFTLAHALIDDGLGGLATVERLAAEARLPPGPPADPDHSSLDLLANVTKLKLPEDPAMPLGREILAAHLEAQVMGPVPEGAPRQALLAWSRAGGDLELRRLEGVYGSIWFNGDGTLALDDALQPQFAGSFSVTGFGSALDRLAAAGVLAPGSAQMAKLMLAAMATNDGGLTRVKLPLTVQDGALSMGPVRLATLRPLDWSWLP
jgi:hypothetical protein